MTAMLSLPRRRGVRATLLVLPAVIPVAIVVIGGIGTTVVQSLGLMPLVGTPALSVEAFEGTDGLLSSALLSLGIAVVSTAIAAVVGFFTAVLIISGNWGGRIVGALSAAAVTVPHLVGAASVGLLLSDSGVLARIFGIPPESWPALVAGPTWFAVIAEYAWKESAFIALIIVGTLATRITSYDETAAVLGAHRGARLRFVVLPLAAPSLLVASTIAFAYTLGSYEVAWLLGKTYPEPLSVMALRLFNSASLTARPEAAAVAVITLLLTAAVVVLAMLGLRRMRAWQ
ncbi:MULTISPECIES: ABC transporter permease subunit [unclassified Salinibacterium]|uniref:ABC transporter permease subunit n=1 Tax=unclassified Salinibacterium TaxID=2632331 RepID=UPI001E3B5581|nr:MULTISPECIES: ABC transporter permease subunit [unclassified Salinibacterium]